MADLSDVTAALRAAVSLALYPTQPPSGNSMAGIPALVQSGWPDPKSLDAAMTAGKGQVTVYPRPTERNMARMSLDWEDQTIPGPTYTLSQTGQVVTVGGAAPSQYFAQNVVVFVDGKPYAVQAQSGNTSAQIAAALQAVIVTAIAGTTVLGSAITIPAPHRIGPLRVGTTGTIIQEVGRQERDFQIVIWAPTPAARHAVAKIVDPALRAINFLTLVDGSGGRLTYKGSPFSDFDQKQGIYRRDLIYAVEYGTTIIKGAEQIVISELDYSPADAGANPITTETLYS